MIDLELYKPHPEKPGYLQFDRMATTNEVADQCTEALKAADLYDELESFGTFADYLPEQKTWPRARWVACFPVEGSNEGHYIHVEATALMEDRGGRLRQTDKRRLMICGKTFGGLEHAISVAATLTRAFYQWSPGQRILIEEVNG